VQHFGSSRVVTDVEPNLDLVRLQGSLRVPHQTYLDAHATWRVPTRGGGMIDDVIVDFGAINVFDSAPPRENPLLDASSLYAYSRYGDPRQRRFELGLSVHF
jgi:hypothetical protein